MLPAQVVGYHILGALQTPPGDESCPQLEPLLYVGEAAQKDEVK